MIYYKVVTKNLRSARYGNLKYKINHWINAPGHTRLFVFDDLYEAIKFQRMDIEDIYECQIIGGTKFFACEYKKDIPIFWHEFRNFLKKKKSFKRFIPSVEITNFPAVLAKSVKLTKKIA